MEENFEDLLEQYIDEDEIEFKKRQDELEEEEEKIKIQTESVFSKEDAISIDRYVNEYLGMPLDCSGLIHKNLKIEFKDFEESKYIMGVDNNFANKNPELVHQGYLLLVIDSHNDRGTYINPFYLKKYISKNAEKSLEEFYKKRVCDLKKIDSYYKEYIMALAEVEKNEKFYGIIKEARKKRQLDELEKRNNDDKHKRK